MSDREIAQYLSRINRRPDNDLIFTRPLSENVMIAKAWPAAPKVTDRIIWNFASYDFFFIKNEMGKYIGAVLNMGSDLHWYIQPKFRKQGYLSKALLQAILPYIFENKDEIQITINKGNGDENYFNSRKVAEKLGFKAVNTDQTTFILKHTDFNWDEDKLKSDVYPLSKERNEELAQRVNYAANYLSKISDELLIAYDDDKNLNEVIFKLKSFTRKIEDLYWENKNN